jgi:hypothetical protein
MEFELLEEVVVVDAVEDVEAVELVEEVDEAGGINSSGLCVHASASNRIPMEQ